MAKPVGNSVLPTGEPTNNRKMKKKAYIHPSIYVLAINEGGAPICGSNGDFPIGGETDQPALVKKHYEEIPDVSEEEATEDTVNIWNVRNTSLGQKTMQWDE